MCSFPSPSGCLRATSEFLFLGTRGAAADESGGGSAVRCRPMTTIEQAVCSVHGCTQPACLHAGFPTPYPTVGGSGGLNGSGADGRAWRRNTGKQAVCAHLRRAGACAQGVPVARTAGGRYASSSERGQIKDNARGERDVALRLTSSAASAFVDADQVHSSPPAAHCQGGRTLFFIRTCLLVKCKY